MSEANHRINNNLQLIIILIEGQIEKMNLQESEEIKKILVKIN
jgi:two-component sensor histidine kinase